MRRRRDRRIGALLAPGGLYVADYRAGRDGLELLGCIEGGTAPANAEEAVARLAELADGHRGAGRLALSLAGYGCVHHILSLPQAAPEVLRPVVGRELARLYPDLEDPAVEFMALEPEDATRVKRSLLAAAAPNALVRHLAEALRERSIELEHLTVAPQVIQRLFDAYAGTTKPLAVLLLVPGMPVLGFFHEGRLRYYREPPASARAGPEGTDVRIIAEQVERGVLYLRQQYRGAAVERLLVAAEPDRQREIEAALSRELTIEVERFGPRAAPPGALMALGAALDAQDGAGLNLIPAAQRPVSGTERIVRPLGVASIALVVMSAIWWSWAAVRAEAGAAVRVAGLERQLEEIAGPLGGIRGTLVERRGHHERTTFLEELDAERARLQQILRTIALASPQGVRLDRLTAERGEADAWTVQIAGTATGYSHAAAALAFNRLYQELSRRLPLREDPMLELPEPVRDAAFAESASGETSVAMVFRISLIVTSGEEAGR